MIRNLFLSLICLLAIPAYAADGFVIPDRPSESGYITIQNPMGPTFQGYVAGPENSRLGILILHDRWGIDDTIRQWVDRFAAKGYRALAIDVFDGRISDQLWLATEIMNASDPEWARADIKAALKYLQRKGRKLITLGAGFGGWQSFQAALAAPTEVAGTVVIYGELEADAEEMLTLRAPLLTIFARDDEKILPAMIEAYRLLLKKSPITYKSFSYPAKQGFMDPRYPSYDAGLVEEVWRQVDEFIADFVVAG